LTGASGPVVRLVATAAPTEGGGHLSRAITLAEALVSERARVTLTLLRGAPSDLQARHLAALGVVVDGSSGGPSADPLTAAAAVTVVDLPNPDEVAARLDPRRLVVFDDSERLRSAAAIVVQPSMPTWAGPARVGHVLAGYAWAPVRSSIRALAGSAVGSSGHGAAQARPEVVVCFGGGDPNDVTGRLVPALAGALRPSPGQPARPDGPRITAIVGPGYRGAVAEGTAWSLVRDPADFDDRLARATVALIGGGTMKAELAALGVPTLVVAVADDQPRVSLAFAATGASRYLGDGRTVAPEDVATGMLDLLGDPVGRAAMAAAGRRTVDGRGAERLAVEILQLAAGR
jgi:UDP-2,4-diacetamido-2,4,6-trideoxy-beta-L-altropyranose hydrolase